MLFQAQVHGNLMAGISKLSPSISFSEEFNPADLECLSEDDECRK